MRLVPRVATAVSLFPTLAACHRRVVVAELFLALQLRPGDHLLLVHKKHSPRSSPVLAAVKLAAEQDAAQALRALLGPSAGSEPAAEQEQPAAAAQQAQQEAGQQQQVEPQPSHEEGSVAESAGEHGALRVESPGQAQGLGARLFMNAAAPQAQQAQVSYAPPAAPRDAAQQGAAEVAAAGAAGGLNPAELQLLRAAVQPRPVAARPAHTLPAGAALGLVWGQEVQQPGFLQRLQHRAAPALPQLEQQQQQPAAPTAPRQQQQQPAPPAPPPPPPTQPQPQQQQQQQQQPGTAPPQGGGAEQLDPSAVVRRLDRLIALPAAVEAGVTEALVDSFCSVYLFRLEPSIRQAVVSVRWFAGSGPGCMCMGTAGPLGHASCTPAVQPPHLSHAPHTAPCLTAAPSIPDINAGLPYGPAAVRPAGCAHAGFAGRHVGAASLGGASGWPAAVASCAVRPWGRSGWLKQLSHDTHVDFAWLRADALDRRPIAGPVPSRLQYFCLLFVFLAALFALPHDCRILRHVFAVEKCVLLKVCTTLPAGASSVFVKLTGAVVRLCGVAGVLSAL